MQLRLHGIDPTPAASDPTFGDDPVWAIHQAAMARRAAKEEARRN